MCVFPRAVPTALLVIAALYTSRTSAQETSAASGASAQPLTEEVIVTAQRREERLQDVPFTVAVVSADQLEQQAAVRATDLTAAVPGLLFGMKGAYAQPSIRGISSQGTGPGVEGNVALFVDGVYQPSQVANLFDLADVSRIEVLKGPQGTLYGRNAAGGAILIATHDPSFEPAGSASVSYGERDDVSAKGFASLPLGDTLAASLSGYFRQNDGFSKDLLRGGRAGAVDSRLLRGKLLFAPSPGSSVVLTGYWSDHTDESAQTGAPLRGNTIGRRLDPNTLIPTQPREVALDAQPRQNPRTHGASLRARIAVSDWGELTATSAWNVLDYFGFSDGDFTPVPFQSFRTQMDGENWSQALDFASEQWGRLRLTTGLLYFEDDTFRELTVTTGGQPAYINSGQKAQAYAGYAEVTYDLSERLSLTGGLRYSHERKRLSGARGSASSPPPAAAAIAEKTWTSTTPRVSLKYDLGDDTSTYVTYSEGFLTGTFNTSSLAPLPVDPENIESIEWGVKSQLHNTALLSAAAFYYDYADLQVATVINNLSQLQNAAAAEVYGIELDGSVAASDRLTLSGGIAWLHSEYTSFPDANVNLPNPACQLCGNVSRQLDVSGNPLIRAPEFTGSITATYELPTSSGTWTLSGAVYHSADFAWEPANRVQQPAYTTLGVTLAWSPPGGALKVMAWARNLTDEEYFQGENDTTAADGVSWAPPRTIGVTLSMSL